MRKGSHMIRESKEKISRTMIGRRLSEEHKRNISIAKKGKSNGKEGSHLSEETKRKISLSNTGKKVPVKVRKEISNTLTGKYAQSKHWNWQGGKSNIKYVRGWTNLSRESIRLRDNYKCRSCGVPQEECDCQLCVHHIDEIREHNDPENLISLCMSCHAKLHNNLWKNR